MPYISRQDDSCISYSEESIFNLVEGSARSILSLAPLVTGRDRLSQELEDVSHAKERGYYTPEEDRRLRERFSRYLTARAGLLQTINELRPITLKKTNEVDPKIALNAFLAAYTASCLLVRAGRFIVDQAAIDKTLRKKLDEAAPRFGVPRKQYTKVYKSLTDPMNAYYLHEATEFADANRDEIIDIADVPLWKQVLEYLNHAEESVRVGKQQYLIARLRYRLYSVKRRNLSAVHKAIFAVFEGSGRVIAEMRNPFHEKRIGAENLQQFEDLLKPGDVIITRHDDAMSNLFLPGFWPHASLHIGTGKNRENLGLELDSERASRWVEPIRVLEARKDGVLLRSLEDTLRVDSVAVIRPNLPETDIARAISRALSHEGKLYDFEFDFTRSDRLVCTEVVYRAFDGIGPMNFQLKKRSGRLTFSAEDLLDLSIDGNVFTPVAVFGVSGGRDRLVTGSDASAVLANSYRAKSEA